MHLAVLGLVAGCGPNAAPLARPASPGVASGATATPAAWHTPTPDTSTRRPTAAALAAPAGRPTPAGAAAAPTVAPPPLAATTATPARSGPPSAPAPTAAAAKSPFPTATPQPDIEYQFATDSRRVPAGAQASAPVPTPDPADASWITVAKGEPMPGVELELRMPSLSVVAGTMVAPEFVLHYASRDDVSLTAGAYIPQDRAEGTRTPDPREFLSIPRTGPLGAYETRVPPGQTRSTTAQTQLPFDSTQPVHLNAGAGLGVRAPDALFASRVTSVQVDLPLQLIAPSQTDELVLELKADRQQWCLLAKDRSGGRPRGPLLIALSARTGASSMMGERAPSITGDIWAERWSQSGDPALARGTDPVTLSVWVGGPHYVTARAEARINP